MTFNTEAIEKYHTGATRYDGKYAKPEEKEAALDFKTRDEYLAWVAEWKRCYKGLSADIRGYKNARKPTAVPFNGSSGRDAWLEARWRRHTACALLYARHEGRKRSWELKTARLAQEA